MFPSPLALAYFCCEAYANLSAAARGMLKSLARLSAVCGIVSSPYSLRIFGFGNRDNQAESRNLLEFEESAGRAGECAGVNVAFGNDA